jgi:hypothetical protein
MSGGNASRRALRPHRVRGSSMARRGERVSVPHADRVRVVPVPASPSRPPPGVNTGEAGVVPADERRGKAGRRPICATKRWTGRIEVRFIGRMRDSASFPLDGRLRQIEDPLGEFDGDETVRSSRALVRGRGVPAARNLLHPAPARGPGGAAARWTGRGVRIADGTCVSKPGGKYGVSGTDWRIRSVRDPPRGRKKLRLATRPPPPLALT